MIQVEVRPISGIPAIFTRNFRRNSGGLNGVTSTVFYFSSFIYKNFAANNFVFLFLM
jgi:hypothetical protein